MMTDHPFDLVIRGGTVADGSGGDLFQADVAVKDGRIATIGKIAASGTAELDAGGLLVTPGFVDIHTHYDGQATWENRMAPSSDHGVTTVVVGNCGVGFAPCRPRDRDELISLMDGVEDIPGIVMAEGIPWEWETFPQYLDFLESRTFDVDIAAQIPHAPLRVYVMGARGLRRERATPADLATMASLVKEAVSAGALGFSTSRSIFHRNVAGAPIPTLDVDEEELFAIAMALKELDQGVLQANSDFLDGSEDAERFDLLRRLAERSGRPLSFTLAQFHWAGDAWRPVLESLEEAHRLGTPIKGQVISRPMGAMLGHPQNLNPLTPLPAYKAMAGLAFDEKIARLRRPEVRAEILAQAENSDADFWADPRNAASRDFDCMYPLRDPPSYDPGRENSIASQARRAGVTPQAFAYDLMLERGGHQLIYHTFANYGRGDLEGAREMMMSEATVIGLADGGAHYGLLCDASQPTSMLTYWGRDRTGEKFSLPWIVKAMSRDTAAAVGLNDRGMIAPGYKADINVIDHDRLTLRAPTPSYDLPAGGQRLTQRAEGYVATLVGGEFVLRHDERTGRSPGRLVRGARPAPRL